MSRQRALEDYGVVLQGDKVDENATKSKRAEIKRFVDGLNYLLYFEKTKYWSLSMDSLRVGVDIGGTFTDIVLWASMAKLS